MRSNVLEPTEKYGYFDVDNKEYVITRPDTPTPWINYLGFGSFGSFISNNGGGLLFDGDPGKRRLTRYRYNAMPVDRPGRYIYIKDMVSGEYYSPTWQPVMRKPDFYECRHGLSYTTIKGEYLGLKSEMTVYIPIDKNYEVWSCKLKNLSGEKRKLKLFPYIEFAHHDGHIDNMMEWARYFMTCTCENKTIVFDSAPEFNNCGPLFGFMSTTLDIDGYDCHRDSFIGSFRNEQNPIAVENGVCSNTPINADQACGAFSCPLELDVDEEKHFLVIVGATKDSHTIEQTVAEALKLENVEKIKEELREKEESLVKKATEQDEITKKMTQELERIAKLTKEEAKQELIDKHGVDISIIFGTLLDEVAFLATKLEYKFNHDLINNVLLGGLKNQTKLIMENKKCKKSIARIYFFC